MLSVWIHLPYGSLSLGLNQCKSNIGPAKRLVFLWRRISILTSLARFDILLFIP